ncbi:MAG: AAA family ATPase [Gammaproteobacteria bacterium]|nr:AAA family ATPase [Gammaproteobacteria bacterium]
MGTDDDGKEHYTTRNIFELENNIQEVAENLNQHVSHPIHPSLIKNIINNYKLNDEQANAIQHILQGSDISIIVGRAGTGKTYALKAAKEAFTKVGYHIQGIALSGIAAQGLQEASGIPSRTIASFTYALRKETLKLTKDDIIILDEAGMTDTYALSEIINHIHKAQAKLILVGDEAQLQPIGPGAPFRALLERVGFAELQQIIRQEEPWQRKATHHLATGNIREALKSYQEHQHIHYNKTANDAIHRLIDDWHHRYNQKYIILQQTLILAHRNSDVMQLNGIARAKRILAGEIDQGFSIKKGEQELWLSVNDRLLFLKNDPKLGVRNGQFGTVKAIESDNFGKVKSITVDLDNNKAVTFDPEHYGHFNHGYSATIHKTQGITVDHSFIYVAGNYWDRNLMYVAGSRHKKKMDLYIDQENHSNLESLIKGLNKDGMKDSVLDYPLNFAKRRGIDIEGLFARIKEHALEKLKVTRKYLHEKYHQLIVIKEKISAQHHKQPEIVSDKHKRHPYLNNACSTQVNEVDDVKRTQEKFQKLLNDLDQAKTLKNHYVVYRLKKDVQLEVKNIYKNKKMHQTIQTKMPEFAKTLEQYHSKQLEYDMD